MKNKINLAICAYKGSSVGLLNKLVIDERYVINKVITSFDKVNNSLEELCKLHNIDLILIKNKTELITLKLNCDILIVNSFPFKLPKTFFKQAKLYAINVHHSLLPKFKGKHPINWNIVSSSKFCGVSIHHLSEDFDSGRIISQAAIPLPQYISSKELSIKLINLSEDILLCTLEILSNFKEIRGMKANANGGDWKRPRIPKDGLIDFNLTDKQIKIMVTESTESDHASYGNTERGRKIFFESIVSNRTGLILAKTDHSILVKTKSGIINLKVSKQDLKILKIGDIFTQ
jgi:methionyl-tRNA formyltransferase